MSTYIKPTLSFTSSVHDATTDPGPCSIALALTTIPNADTRGRLTVDHVYHRLIETSGTLNADANGHIDGNGPIDGSAFATASGADSDGNDNVTAGTVGGFIYLKNNSTTTNENIFIGIAASSGATDPQAPAAPVAAGGGTTALDNDTHDTLRTMTLKPGEFAFFPWDFTGDMNWQAQTGTPELELWIFDRG